MRVLGVCVENLCMCACVSVSRAHKCVLGVCACVWRTLICVDPCVFGQPVCKPVGACRTHVFMHAFLCVYVYMCAENSGI